MAKKYHESMRVRRDRKERKEYGAGMGKGGDYANLPQKEKFQMYPYPEGVDQSGYADDLEGIDRVNSESVREVRRQPTMQK